MFAQNAIGFWAASESYDADLVTYMTGLSTPLSDGQKTLLNTYILALKLGLSITNLSDAFDVMYIFANETSEAALRNLVKRANDATTVNSPTFTALEGYTGASTKYLRSNFIPATHGVNCKKDDISYGVYTRINNATDNVIFGARDAGTTYSTNMWLRDSNTTYWIVQATNTNITTSNTDSRGLYIGQRTASNNSDFYNKNVKTSGNRVSVKLETEEIYILAYNAGGTPLYYSPNQISLFFAGKKLTNANVATINTVFEAYMDANGKGVIT